MQRAVFNNAYFESCHVEFQRRVAAVVDEYQIGVELYIGIAGYLDGRVRFARAIRGTCDSCEESAGW